MTELRYEFCPPYAGSGVDHVGTYKRTLPVNLDRMYENALDWEHLPHLHGSSFGGIECIEAGGWGWRCRVIDGRGRESILELALDRSCRRWITRNLEGPSKGAEIWTHVFVTGPQLMDLVIDYFVPGVPEADREKVGRVYAAAYERLYDEDVWMMTERQRRLDERLDSVEREANVRIPLPSEFPAAFSMAGRDFQLHQLDGAWVVYPAACPHQLGPLDPMQEDGTVHCPWHGYRFDVQSGECLTGSSCRFGQRPRVLEEAGGELLLGWS